MAIAAVVALVVLGGIKRIAKVASYLVPFMVTLYFVLVSYIIVTHIHDVPRVIASIFTEAFNIRAGWGALAGIAIIGARRAAFVNDAGIGTATIMHGASRNTEPVREGLVAMLGPAIDSGLVCTLTALAILLCGDISSGQLQGLTVAMQTFRTAIPYGDMFLLAIVLCFAMSSMFSYSFYGFTCASYLWGQRKARWYTYFFHPLANPVCGSPAQSCCGSLRFVLCPHGFPHHARPHTSPVKKSKRNTPLFQHSIPK